ncbi:MAG: acyltransferase 3 family protein [Hyphomicrobiales bacterium]|nr:acyltransferase 3 family protein [Hyphomicrobiales bacterium]
MKHQRLISLEAGRFVAALAVMLYHFTDLILKFRGEAPLDWSFRAGHAGVEYFFVLSGFIIYSVHRRDLGFPGALSRFALKRMLRIYPPFILATLAMLTVYALVPSLAEGKALGWERVADILLLPMQSPATLGVSWSLRHEMVFYAIFGVAIALGARGMRVLIAWQVMVVAAIPFFDLSEGGTPLTAVLGPFNLGFGMGMLTAWGAERLEKPFRALAAGVAALLTLACTEWWIGRDLPISVAPLGPLVTPLCYSVAAALIVAGLIGWERAGGTFRHERMWTLLGGSSYLLYLLHGMVGSVLIRIVPASVPPAATLCLLCVTAVLVAVLAHRLVEAPFLRWSAARLATHRA